MKEEQTLLQKARTGSFDTENLIINLNRCKEIANTLSLYNLVDNTSREIGLIAELIYRIQNMPSIEYVDFDSMLEDYYIASGGSRKGDWSHKVWEWCLPHKRKIKGKDHYIFSGKQEFRKKYPDEPIVDNWKEAEESQWCYSDDKQIVMGIKKGSFQGSGTDKRKVTYIRTLLGMVNINSNSTLAGSPAKNIYSL